jgi:hypothetical protein
MRQPHPRPSEGRQPEVAGAKNEDLEASASGVPSDEADIRLGDVVISKPYMHHGGVVQYDFGIHRADS